MQPPLDLGAISLGLRETSAGVWSAEPRPAVSFPDQGHARCLQVEDSSFWFRHRNACILALLERFPPAGPLFDVGGGNGFVAAALEAAGYRAIVVEPGSEGVQNARARGLAPVVHATLESAGFRDGSLAAIALFDVLEHIEDDVSFLVTCRRLLIAGGHLYLTVPAHGWLWSSIDELSGHYRRYSERGLLRCLRAAGLQPVLSSYIFSWLPLPILLLRVLPSRLGLDRSVRLERERRLHTAGGRGSKAVQRLLAAEARLLRRGDRLSLGASAVAVATAPHVEATRPEPSSASPSFER